MGIPLADLLKAAGEPTRIRILNLLRSNGVCVCDLQSVLRLPQSTISRHLVPLRSSGLVLAERQGSRVCYSMPGVSGTRHKAFRRFLDEVCPTESQLREDLLRLRRSSGASGRGPKRARV